MADTAKHTPGPWKVGIRSMDVGCVNAKDGGYAKLFDVRGWGYFTGHGHGGLAMPFEDAAAMQDANARLIAAAPELLDALHDAAVAIEALLEKPDDESRRPHAKYHADKARSLVAKAEGRS